MKILITGGSGFIGKRITTLLKGYNITSLSSKDCDLLDLNQVERDILVSIFKDSAKQRFWESKSINK